MDVLLLGKDGCRRQRPGEKPEAEAVWCDLGVPDEEELAAVGEWFDLHDLALEAALEGNQRPKVEEYADHLLIVFYAVSGKGEQEVALFLGRNYLVTAHPDGMAAVDAAKKALLDPNRRKVPPRPDYVCYRILDTIVDGYFDRLDDLDERISVLEDRIFEDPERDTAGKIFNLRREIAHLRRLVGHERDAVNVLAHRESGLISDEMTFYFRDLYDHLIRVADTLDSYRDLLSSALDTYLSTISNSVNDVMKSLTIIATIFLPITFITGFFGMNFVYFPFLRAASPVPFLFTVVLMVATAAGMLLYFRRKGWI
jgi:magnesium transporter